MTCNRYLLYFSYIGTTFQGAQRQVNRTFVNQQDLSTVQGQIENALKLLNPSAPPVIKLSSRTDAGVHALNTTCHVDLFRSDSVQYEPKTVTLCLNKHFASENVPIRILKTFIVPEEFNCRHHAVSRTYLYRLGVIKADDLNVAPNLHLLPIEELQRCYFICTNTFDVDEMKKASKLFEGLHDFRTFMGRGSHMLDKVTRRLVNRVEVVEGKPFTYCSYSWPSFVCNKDDYQFYDIYVEATGFLYRQVRRMVASLVAVAQGKIPVSDITLMLQVPSQRSWDDRIKTVPAHGLYLCEVEYLNSAKAAFRASLEGGQ